MKLQNKNRAILLGSVFAIALFSNLISFGQTLIPNSVENQNLILIEEQFRGEHYALAVQMASKYLAGSASNHNAITDILNTSHAKYILTASCIKIELEGWEDSATNFISTTDNPVYKQRVSYFLAQNYFKHNKLAQAIPYYESAGISNLSNDEIADEKFEIAYCYFNNKQFDKAEPLFSSIKEIKDGKYYKAGNYYYGLLAYNENKFEDALNSFDNIKTDRQYRLVVPYYIAEIYYFIGSRTRALTLAESLINNSEKSYYDNELHLLAAQCLFEDEKYKEAMPYFESYYEHTDKIRKEDLYKMAYCNYRLSQWTNAIEKFKLLSNAHDSLGQTSMYLLGDCYLKTNDKPSAKNAFGLCADLDLNLGQQEASMMLYSMICYELGFDDEAARQLKNLLTTFPSTDYKDEANKLLSDLLIKTHNYADALKYLDKVKRKDEDYKKTHQKATYGYAIQQYKKGEYLDAYKYLNQALVHPANPYYETATYFWKGEVEYKLHNYEDAIISSQEFIAHKGDNPEIERISPMATTQHAYINMGFAAMAQQDYKEAQGFFASAQQTSNSDKTSVQVAALHEADALFMQKSYPKAIVLYNKIITSDTTNADYAKFQKGIILGLQGKNNDKINLLQTLATKGPESQYSNAAKYEIANTYIESDKYPQALKYLTELADSEAEDNSYSSRALIKTGFIYQQTKEIEKAIVAYKQIVRDFPTSEERMPALDALKNIYIQGNNPEEYTKMLKENNLPSADSGSIDSAFYAAAEMQFSSGNWEVTKKALKNYLDKFPNGIFALKAHYYRGECNYQLKAYKEALADYKEILDNTWNDFSENSARHSATIAYDEKNYQAAIDYYTDLRQNSSRKGTLEFAYSGIMKSYYYLGKPTETGLYADSILALQDIAAESINEALLFKANSFRLANKAKESLQIFKQLSNNKNGEIAAESRYYIADAYLKQDSLQMAEGAANETIKLSAGYDYWIVKSYILLADILIKQKDYFNAKATLESIVKHTKITELKTDAMKKLDDVIVLEKQKSKLKED